MTRDGGPAFPVECSYYDGRIEGKQTSPSAGWEKGMSLRDYFAATALNAFLTWSDARDIPGNVHAQAAYDLADAMLEARAEKEVKP